MSNNLDVIVLDDDLQNCAVTTELWRISTSGARSIPSPITGRRFLSANGGRTVSAFSSWTCTWERVGLRFPGRDFRSIRRGG